MAAGVAELPARGGWLRGRGRPQWWGSKRTTFSSGIQARSAVSSDWRILGVSTTT